MKSLVVKSVFCVSFFACVCAAENPGQFPFVARTKNLGDTGETQIFATPKPSRLANKLKKDTFPNDSFCQAENIRISPRDKQLKPGYKPTIAPELSNPPVKK